MFESGPLPATWIFIDQIASLKFKPKKINIFGLIFLLELFS